MKKLLLLLLLPLLLVTTGSTYNGNNIDLQYENDLNIRKSNISTESLSSTEYYNYNR